MMCEAARMLLDAYLDNQLSPLQRGKVDEHLRECRACARIVDESRGYHACLEAYYAFIKPSDSLVESALFNLADAEIGKKRTASDLKTKSTVQSGGKLEAHSPPRRRGVLALLGVVLVAGAGIGWYFLSRGPASVGRVEAATGTVERRAAGAPAFVLAPAGTALAAGDVVRAAAGGRASVSAPPVRMELSESSVATVRGTSIDSKFEVSVDQGAASIEAVRGEEKVVVATTAARATVIESKDYLAEVAVEARPAESVFSVKRGTFRVEGGGGEVRVGEGMKTVVKPGRPPGPAEPATASAATPPDRKPPAKDAGAAPEPPVVQAARRGEAECLAAVLASPTLGRSELPAVQRWVEQQKRPEDVRPGATALAAIARSLPANAPDAVASLSRIAAGDASGENRAAAVEALASVPGAAAVKALEGVAARDKDAAVARRAATALALRDDREAAAAVLTVLKGSADASVKKEAAKGALFADPAAATAALGAELPGELLAEAEKGTAGLAAAIRLARDPVVRFQVLVRAETVAAAADPADAGLAPLGDELASVAQSDANPLLRRRAALSLGSIPKAASAAATAALEAARSDRDESVKVAAALAHLKREGKDGGGVAAASLYQQLRSAEQKLALASGLARSLPAEGAVPLLQKISDGEKIPALKAAVDAVRRSVGGPGGAGPRTPPETSGGDPIAGASDEDPAVRARSIAALARRPADDAAAREAIFGAFQDAEETVRAAAVAAAARYKDDEAFEALRSLLARDPSAAVRGAALPLVAAFSQREDLAEILGTALGEEADEEMRAKIVQSLTRLPGKPATEALVRALSQDGSPLVQSAVIRSLGSRKERDAGQALVDALSSSDPAVVAEVVAALRQFAGESFPFDANGEPDARDAELATIREWWAANGDSYP